MRKIKFRAWLPSDSKMTRPHTIPEWAQIAAEEAYPVGVIFLQFTGLLDKNGKEIYEGDIFKHGSGTIPIIEFKQGGFGWYDQIKEFIGFAGHRHLKMVLEGESIGNIYENPELLK